MNEEFMDRLSEEIRQKLAACKTRDEIRKVLDEAGAEPLDEEDLAVVAGGSRGPVQGRVVYNNE